jgi:hypothetical protein
MQPNQFNPVSQGWGVIPQLTGTGNQPQGPTAMMPRVLPPMSPMIPPPGLGSVHPSPGMSMGQGLPHMMQHPGPPFGPPEPRGAPESLIELLQQQLYIQGEQMMAQGEQVKALTKSVYQVLQLLQGDHQEEVRNQFYSHVATNIGKANLRDWTARFRSLAQRILPAMSEADLIFHYSKAMRQATRLQLLGKRDELKTLNAVCAEADEYETNLAGVNPTTTGPTYPVYERHRNQRDQNGPFAMDLSVQEGNRGGGRGGPGRGTPNGGRGPQGGRGGRGGQFRENDPPRKTQQPLPWVKPEDLAQRRENRTCLSCGSDQHRLKECPTVLEYNAKQASEDESRPHEGAAQA